MSCYSKDCVLKLALYPNIDETIYEIKKNTPI